MKHLDEALLMSVQGIGGRKLTKLLDYFGDAGEAWAARRQDLQTSGCLGMQEIDALLEFRERTDLSVVAKNWAEKGIRICTQADPEYPELLRKIFDPPYLLFYRGDVLPDALYFAIVGSRRSTSYGRTVAREFSEKLAKGGMTIVSGAARGIDTAAHEGALAAGCPTVAVLGCGVDISYPPENGHLLNDIAATGCVISEYLPGTPPNPGRFPERNRIVAGMSVGVMVVEAAEKSGALITADLALNENRDVYAVPGSVYSDASRGTNRLIQQGARLLAAPEELLEEWGLALSLTAPETAHFFGGLEKKVWLAMEPGEYISVDRLVALTGLEVARLQVVLLQMELAGYLVKDSVRGYARSTKE